MRGYRRSVLFVSGNNPKMLQDAPVFGSDGVVFDLESAVPPEDKDSARLLVREALTFLDYSKVDVIVKINPLTSKYGLNDIEMIAKAKPFAFMVPRASHEQMHEIDKKLACIESKEGFTQGSIKLIPIIETAYALEYVNNIITSTPRITGAFLNAEGLTADFGMKRTREGEEIIYARSRVVVACRAQKQNVIDTPFLDGNDYEGLYKDALKARNMGFTGKAAIDGRQIDIIHEIFE